MYHGCMASEITVSEARSQLSELVGRVRFGGEQFVLTRHGKGVAALVPLEALPSHGSPDATPKGRPRRVEALDLRSEPGSPGEIAARVEPPSERDPN